MKFYILHCAEKNPPQDSYMKTQTFETNTEKQVPIQLKKNGNVICDTDNTVLEKQALKSAAGLPNLYRAECKLEDRPCGSMLA